MPKRISIFDKMDRALRQKDSNQGSSVADVNPMDCVLREIATGRYPTFTHTTLIAIAEKYAVGVPGGDTQEFITWVRQDGLPALWLESQNRIREIREISESAWARRLSGNADVQRVAIEGVQKLCYDFAYFGNAWYQRTDLRVPESFKGLEIMVRDPGSEFLLYMSKQARFRWYDVINPQDKHDVASFVEAMHHGEKLYSISSIELALRFLKELESHPMFSLLSGGYPLRPIFVIWAGTIALLKGVSKQSSMTAGM